MTSIIDITFKFVAQPPLLHLLLLLMMMMTAGWSPSRSLEPRREWTIVVLT
jgi:hypothetical protein